MVVLVQRTLAEPTARLSVLAVKSAYPVPPAWEKRSWSASVTEPVNFRVVPDSTESAPKTVPTGTTSVPPPVTESPAPSAIVSDARVSVAPEGTEIIVKGAVNSMLSPEIETLTAMFVSPASSAPAMES